MINGIDPCKRTPYRSGIAYVALYSFGLQSRHEFGRT
jgi:hypothetical protein